MKLILKIQMIQTNFMMTKNVLLVKKRLKLKKTIVTVVKDQSAKNAVVE